MIMNPPEWILGKKNQDVLVDGLTESDLRKIAARWYDEEYVANMTRRELLDFYLTGV